MKPLALLRLGAPAACLLLAACQQEPKQVDGHDVTRTTRAHGKKVNILAPNGDDLKQTVDQAAEMKKSADQVTFTPEEQAKGK